MINIQLTHCLPTTLFMVWVFYVFTITFKPIPKRQILDPSKLRVQTTILNLTRKNQGLFGKRVNPLPDDKILDWPKLKQTVDDILKCI